MKPKHQEYKKHRIFLKAIQAYRENKQTQFKKLCRHPSLNQTERRLLEARQLLSKRKWLASQKVLESIKDNSSNFLYADQHSLLAYIFSHLDRLHQAVTHSKIAIKYFELSGHLPSLFICYFNLSVYKYRRNNIKAKLFYLNKAEEFATNPFEKLHVWQSKAAIYSKAREYDLAIDCLKKARKIKPHVNPVSQKIFLSSEASILFKSGRHDQAFEIWDQLKRVKSQLEKAEVLLYWHLYRYYKQGKLLQQTPESIKKSPKYYLKWKIVKAAYEGKEKVLHQLWQQLTELYPELYGPKFKTYDPSEKDSLFILAIFKNSKKAIIMKPFFKQGSKQELLYTALTKSSFPLTKENLIEKIWNIPYEPKYDSRLYKLVQRFNESNIDVQIENINRSYSIVTQQKAA